MDAIQQQISDILQKCKERIQSNMQSQGINASGRTSRSIKVVTHDKGVKLTSQSDEKGFAPLTFGGGGFTTGIAPMSTLEIGRPGGNVPRGFYYIIKQWTRDKGLQFGSERERGTFAYFTAQKIAREGTERNKANKDVYSTPVKEAVAEIKQVLGAEISKMIKTNF